MRIAKALANHSTIALETWHPLSLRDGDHLYLDRWRAWARNDAHRKARRRTKMKAPTRQLLADFAISDGLIPRDCVIQLAAGGHELQS